MTKKRAALTEGEKRFVTQYGPRLRVGIEMDPSEKMTKDSFKDECDINILMARYDKAGELPSLVARDPQYGDFTDVPTYQEAMDTVLRAQDAFAALPAQVRAECLNDPAVFLEKVKERDWVLKHKLALPAKTVAAAEAAGTDQGSGGGRPPGEPKADPKADKSDKT